MSYLTIKYIKGNPYLYQVRSVREGVRVRQVFERYLGRADRADRESVEVIPVARREWLVVTKPTAKSVAPTVTVEAGTPSPVEPAPITAPVTPEVTSTVPNVQIQGNKVIRDDGLELGILNRSAQMPISKTGAYQGSGSWYAKPVDGRGKYFVNSDNAVKWLERQGRNKLPISRLGEMLGGKPKPKPLTPTAPVTPEVTKLKAVRLTPEAEVQTSYQILKDKLTSEGINPNVIDIALETYGFKLKIDRVGAVLTRESLQFKLQDDIGVENTIRELAREILGKKFEVPVHEVDLILEGGSRVRPDVDIAEAEALARKIADLIKRGLPTRKELLSRYLPEPAIPKAPVTPEVTRLQPTAVPAKLSLAFKDNRVILNGKDVGLLEILPQTRAKRGGNGIEISRLYLNEESQRQGIGTAIVDKLFKDNPNVDFIDVYPGGKSAPFWFKRGTTSVDDEGYYRITRKSIPSEVSIPKVPVTPEVIRATPPARHEVPEYGEEGAIPPPISPAVAKTGRRRVLEARLKRGEPVPAKLLEEFPDLQVAIPKVKVGMPERIFYHGTHQENVESIVKTGFIPSEDGTAGRGIYIGAKPEEVLYERSPALSAAVKKMGRQPDFALPIEVKGELYDAGRQGAKDAWSLYLRPQVYAATKLYPDISVKEAMDKAPELLKAKGYAGVKWQFADGRNAAVVFEPSDIKAISPEAKSGTPEVTKEVVTPTVPAVERELTPETKTDATILEKDFNRMSHKEVVDELKTQGKPLLIDDLDKLGKLANYRQGYKPDIDRPVLVHKAIEHGVMTDGFLLVESKEATEQIIGKFLKNEEAKEARKIQKLNPNLSKEEAEATAREMFEGFAKQGTFPDYKQVYPSELGKEAKLVGVYAGGIEGIEVPHPAEVLAYLSDGENIMAVNADKLAFVMKHLPDAKMFLSTKNPTTSAITFMVDDKRKGLLMPMETHGNIPPIIQENALKLTRQG